MEALGLGLEALGKSIGICARSFAMIYIVGIGYLYWQSFYGFF